MVSLPEIPALFIKMLQIAVPDIHHVGFHIIGLHGIFQAHPCQWQVLLLQSQFNQLRINVIQGSLIIHPAEKVITAAQIIGRRVRLVHQQKDLTHIDHGQIPFKLHVGIFPGQRQRTAEIPQCRRIILTEIIRVAPVVQIHMLLIRTHLVKRTFGQIEIIVTTVKVTQLHVHLSQSVINRETVFFSYLKRIKHRQRASVPERSEVKMAAAYIGISQIDTDVRKLLTLSGSQSTGVGFLKSLCRQIHFRLPSVQVSLHIINLAIQSLDGSIVVAAVAICPHTVHQRYHRIKFSRIKQRFRLQQHVPVITHAVRSRSQCTVQPVVYSGRIFCQRILHFPHECLINSQIPALPVLSGPGTSGYPRQDSQ